MNLTKLIDRLEEVIGAEGEPRHLGRLIEDELHATFNLDHLEASETAERILDRAAAQITLRALAANEIGTFSVLTLVGSMNTYVSGTHFPRPGDSQELLTAKRNRRFSQEVLTAIRALTFGEFERFGARTLVLLGASAATITPHGNDQGIDFHGKLTLGQHLGLPAPYYRLAHDVGISFAGQAKHYPKGSLSTSFVRELIGAVSLARIGLFSKEDLPTFSEAGFLPFSPIVVMLFTTGGLTSGARRLAASAGIIARSGDQLAAFLADNGVGIVDKNGIPTFDPAAFEDWVSAR